MKPPRPGDAPLQEASTRLLTFEDFEDLSEAYDGDVRRYGAIDPFCTRSDWIVPARRAFAESARPWIHRFDEGWAPLMRIDTVLGRTIVPFEYGWGFAQPLVGPDQGALATRLVDALLADRASWDALFLSGLTRGGSAFVTLVHRLRRRHQLRLGEPAIRCIASLEGGWEGFLSRRESKFRRNLRREERKAGERFRFEVIADASPAGARVLYHDLLAVEERSWKGREGVGIDAGPMRRFYARMVPRLAERGALRVTQAWEGDRMVGYVLGGIAGHTYRGLQISFDDAYRDLGVGNLMQAATIRWLCEHEPVDRYDLGGDLAYKRRWAEDRVETVPLLVR